MEIMIAVISSGALSAVISGLFTVAQNRRKCHDGIQAGVRQLLYDRIKSKGRDYIAAGEVSSEDLEDLIDAHKIYHDDLQGNGFLDRIMDEVKKLKVTK